MLTSDAKQYLMDPQYNIDMADMNLDVRCKLINQKFGLSITAHVL